MNDVIGRVEAGIAAIARGEFVILVDDEDRENEGDLVMAAEKITPEAINFMACEARGLICLTMTGSQLDRLQIPMMVTSNKSPYQTAFAVSIEARTGVTTGISAADRARTIQVAVADESTAEDIVMPGHIFPLRARDGGVLVRTGQTEGSVDLSILAGLKPAGVICEIMNQDGTMSRMPDLEVFAEKHGLVILSVADIIAYRLQKQSLVTCIREEPLPTEYPGDWKVRVYKSVVDDHEHFAFVCGTPRADQDVLVRVQHRADTFDVFTRKESESIASLEGSMKVISEAGQGVIVYLERNWKSASAVLDKHLKQIDHAVDVNQPQGALRDLGIGAQILVDCGVRRLRVLTNRPRKILGTEAYGLEIVDHVSIS
jgi:3,4-dihydroxy 2-butanone 4-phosphate synthase/GTP cyclohydrolase II